MLPAGSSPLTRGKLRTASSRACQSGLIPAHAGKTRLATKRAARSTAHPRSRGENRRDRFRLGFRGGSSPLTRGKHVGRQSVIVSVRLIPAHAGKTQARQWKRWGPSAHPRSRGENAYVTGADNLCSGSSPLTRGKPWSDLTGTARPRLIPAHAGKTRGFRAKTVAGGAHPRSRGENDASASPARASGGSSPLTRGKLVVMIASVLASGLIPAHAGKTDWRQLNPMRAAAHPRSRGENGQST